MVRRNTIGSLSLLGLLTLAQACGSGEPPSGGSEVADEEPLPGRLVIVGGALQADNADVYQAVVDGREGDGPLCVIPTAGGNPVGSMESATATIATYAGEGAVKGILISTENAEVALDPAVAAELESCSGFYFTGGSQSRILDVFLPGGDTTPSYRALWKRWQEGAVVAGSSAGAAMMSGVMISGGGSDEALAVGIATGPDEDGVQLRPGMGFFAPAILDQHFLARGRIGRLLVTVLATDSVPMGFGIDENTAVVVEGDTAWVLGASGVVVVDGRSATRTAPNRGSGLRVTLAGTGDGLDLNTFAVQRGAAKTSHPAMDSPLILPEDPLGRWEFLHLMVGLASSPDSEASFTIGDAVLTVREGEGFSASVTAAEGGVEGAPAGFSAGPFVVELVDRED